jgi:hypothetical protein
MQQLILFEQPCHRDSQSAANCLAPHGRLQLQHGWDMWQQQWLQQTAATASACALQPDAAAAY